MKNLVLALVLFGCAEDLTPPAGDEPVAGSVAVSVQPLTATVTLQSVYNHFSTNGVPNGVTYSVRIVNGVQEYRPVLWEPLYWRVGDTATFPVVFGWYPGTAEAAQQHVCKILSGRKLYLRQNGTYVKGLNLEGKLVVTQ